MMTIIMLILKEDIIWGKAASDSTQKKTMAAEDSSSWIYFVNLHTPAPQSTATNPDDIPLWRTVHGLQISFMQRLFLCLFSSLITRKQYIELCSDIVKHYRMSEYDNNQLYEHTWDFLSKVWLSERGERWRQKINLFSYNAIGEVFECMCLSVCKCEWRTDSLSLQDTVKLVFLKCYFNPTMYKGEKVI